LYLELQIQDPIPFVHQLSQALNRIPNIRQLEITFPLIRADDQSWDGFQIQPNTFPTFAGLKTLSVNYERWTEDSIPVPPSAVRPLLLEYGEQLTTIKLDSFVFQGDQWESFRFPNLNKLQVDFDFRGGHAEIYNNMMELDCPQLKTLILRWNIVFTAETFLVFNAFRGTLVELYIDGQVELRDILDVDPMVIQEFPKLVQLTLDINDVSSKVWHLFRTQFSNLQDLRFLKRHNTPDQQLSVNERRWFFSIFPRLKRITWMEINDNSEVVSTIVFGRESIY